ncbi:hypothetical protein BH11PAT2_BH11PAT2_10320 [soil metagenome]
MRRNNLSRASAKGVDVGDGITGAGLDEQLSSSITRRMRAETRVNRNTSTAVAVAPDPKGTERVQLNHVVRLQSINAEKTFLLRMGGYGEDLPDATPPICDYMMMPYRSLMLKEVGDTVDFPQLGEVEIIEILMPEDPAVAQMLQAA